MKSNDLTMNNILEGLQQSYNIKEQLLFCDDIIDIYNHKYVDYKEYANYIAQENYKITLANNVIYDKEIDNYDVMKTIGVYHSIIDEKLFIALQNKK